MSRDAKFTHDALLGAYEKRLLERIDSETEALASGRATDFVDYKARTSRITTFKHALDDLSAVVKTYLEEDEDEDD